MERILFYILAASILIFGAMSVTGRNLLRSAVYLFFVLLTTAGYYILAGYQFLGAVQITLYAGGIVVLIIFSILLTQDIDKKLELPPFSRLAVSAVLSALAAGFVIWVFSGAGIPEAIASPAPALKRIGEALLNPGTGGFLLPFELISVLLLAVMFGAIVIAKQSQESNQQDKKP